MVGNAVDALVVGAGPGGAVAALQLARRGLRPLLLDAKHFPRVKPCAGGISPRGRSVLRRLGLWDKISAAGYTIDGIRLVAPSGRETTLLGAESAVVLPRARLDAMLVEEAVRAGASFRDGTRAAELLLEDGRAAGVRTATGEELRARWVIAADGAPGRFAADPRPRYVLHSCMGWYEGLPFTPHLLEMMFDPALVPHYGWLFPEGPERVNIGICVEPQRHAGTPIRELFQRFLDKYFAERLRSARQIGDWRGHPIVATVGIEHHAPPGVLLVGEACRLVNCATGEGISYAMQSAMLAGDAVADACDDPSTSSGQAAGDLLDVSKGYERGLRKAFALPYYASDLFRRRGMALLDPIARLGNNALFRRLTRQPPASPTA